jgi:hypothetical protein
MFRDSSYQDLLFSDLLNNSYAFWNKSHTIECIRFIVSIGNDLKKPLTLF